MVCGTIVRAVCSRSQGQSRRSRSVSCWSSSSADERLKSPGGGPSRRSRRLAAHLVLRPPPEALLRVVPPLREGVLLLLRQLLLFDRRLHLVERVRRRFPGLVDGPAGLNHVPAELRMHRLGDLVRLERKRDPLERRDRLQRAADRLLLADRPTAARRPAPVASGLAV